MRTCISRHPGPVVLVGLIMLVLLAGRLLARDAIQGVHANAGSLVRNIDEFTRIDWTNGVLYARAEVRLPRIVFDSSNPEFGQPGTATSITGARSQARFEARELAALRLMNALTGLQLDSRFTVREKMNQDRVLREQMGYVSDHFVVRSRHTGEGYVSVELALPFLGDNGLYALLSRSYYNTRPVPEVGPVDVVDEVTGIVIDMREFPDFQPSLEPRIFSDQGRMIYGPEMVTRTCAMRRGMGIYYTSDEMARRDRRVGLRPYYVYAAGLVGPDRTDLYLDAHDVERLLGHASGRQALHYCAVVFVMPAARNR
ncbi:MAG: hypothetical protein KDK30_07625 [Leptospiraceae bacterium]|nr:hypothetical protein [Leptospiraceae bacterium]MCB1319525.1 hypothetical protein [Leptospiraceae bacterium]